MTICTGALRLLEEFVRCKDVRRLDDLVREARAFLADTPACDAEKAALVAREAVLVAASRHKHDVGKEWETINCRLCFGSWRTEAEEAHYPDCVFADGIAPAAAALLAQGERLKAVEDALNQAGPNVEGCACERDGDEDSPLCPMHVSKFGVLRKETLSFLLVDYEAQFEAFRAALAPGEAE